MNHEPLIRKGYALNPDGSYSKSRQADRAPSRPVPERTVCHEPLATQEGEKEGSSRVRISIVSRRRRLLDPDNLCPKYFIDCVRHAEYIRDDTANDIELSIAQIKVASKEDEGTEIIVEQP